MPKKPKKGRKQMPNRTAGNRSKIGDGDAKQQSIGNPRKESAEPLESANELVNVEHVPPATGPRPQRVTAQVLETGINAIESLGCKALEVWKHHFEVGVRGIVQLSLIAAASAVAAVLVSQDSQASERRTCPSAQPQVIVIVVEVNGKASAPLKRTRPAAPAAKKAKSS